MILAILQARVSSTRLPGKILRPIMGVPMLERHLDRLRSVRNIDRLIVATSVEKSDLPVAALCRELGIDCFRGSLDNVLDRFYHATESYNPDVIVRLTGDCPLADPGVIDGGIDYFLKSDYDYVSNSLERTYPIGLDFEVFRFKCLREAWQEARLPSELEHVTPFIYNRPERYSIGHFRNDVNQSHHRWTVDEPEDFRFVTAVYDALYPLNSQFTMRDILDLLASRPELTEINYHIVHGAGYQKSLCEDAQYKAVKEAAESQPA